MVREDPRSEGLAEDKTLATDLYNSASRISKRFSLGYLAQPFMAVRNGSVKQLRMW